ncbi:DUF4398 domain-containing protein [Pseudoxanthomonas suwonensis]|uniref:Membrane protein n=1 Tax=Pseudoxanthomonas suwonensis TaxID=314722 RepID=A0A0E3UNI8_9GAMM|nr:DUF4398 domain-containing protein [Pseudoxanthomonas suwonensis]AKC87211.1 membrane protein [Pseudoxanthomonas suwonensis]
MNEPSFAHFRRRLYALVVASGLAVTAQAQVASPDLHRAQQAVQQAQDADADHYAPELLDTARQALVRAQAGALSRSRGERREADQLARQAAADADLARVRSDRAQAEAGLLQRRDEIARLRESLGLPAEATP